MNYPSKRLNDLQKQYRDGQLTEEEHREAVRKTIGYYRFIKKQKPITYNVGKMDCSSSD